MTIRALPGLQVVDLSTIRAAALQECWQRQVHWWREQLLWDVADTLEALQRVVERGAVPGKAVQIGQQIVGYTYYGMIGDLGVLLGVHVLPTWSHAGVGEALLQETVTAMQQQGASRIESPCLAIDCPWLPAVLEQQGFQTYWREFRRVNLQQAAVPALSPTSAHLEPWQGSHGWEVAALMQAAYAASSDAESNVFYRTLEGCQDVLDSLLNQGNCGRLIAAASAVVRHRGESVGCILVTEIAPRQSHLVQVMVLPAFQQQGIGRRLLHYSMSQLATLHYETLSLLVSGANHRAIKVYQALGWPVIRIFPLCVWERSKNSS